MIYETSWSSDSYQTSPASTWTLAGASLWRPGLGRYVILLQSYVIVIRCCLGAFVIPTSVQYAYFESWVSDLAIVVAHVAVLLIHLVSSAWILLRCRQA
jgi:hypothetical protein